jgi:hypothetical protein
MNRLNDLYLRVFIAPSSACCGRSSRQLRMEAVNVLVFGAVVTGFSFMLAAPYFLQAVVQ